VTTSRLPEQIEARRIRLRRPVISDATAIFHSYTQDPLVCRFLVWQPHKSESVARDFIASCIEAWGSANRLAYVITENSSSAAIGMIEARIQGATVDMGYVLARSHWGKGIMSEAIDALAKAALALPHIFRVQAFCDTENSQSQRVLEKAGLKREGRLDRWIVHPNISPEPRACFMYATVK
jgi:[ribosomal protein S5]-alanine N-acetyltransferase